MLLLSYLLPLSGNQNISYNGFGEVEYVSDRQTLGSKEIIFPFLPTIINSLIIIIGFLIVCESLFFWVPSLTDITKKKAEGKMIWQKKLFCFPERIFSILDDNILILIRRKRSSLKGILMKEFTMEIHLDKEIKEIKQISDFVGIEKVVHTHSHSILLKTVNLKSLPLQILQIRTILALMVISPVKSFSDIQNTTSSI